MDTHNNASNETPEMISERGYTLALQAGRLNEGIALCEKAISLCPNRPENYLNLGRAYLLAKKKETAIKTFKTGLRIRKDPTIIYELRRLGIRKPPFVRSLSRDNVINIWAGKFFAMLKLR
jgi:tetratricopeptide (TPR) repeat protein